MKPLQINFAPKRVLPLWFWVGLNVIGVMLAIIEGRQTWLTYQALQAAKAQVALQAEQTAQRQEAERLASMAAHVTPPYAQDAIQTAHMAAMPIDQVLVGLEKTRVLGIQVTNLDLSTVDGSVRIDVQFQDQSTLLKYIEELNLGEDTPRWRLLEAKQGATPDQNSAVLVSKWGAK